MAKRPPKKPSPRAARREAAREGDKLVELRLRLAKLEEGGAPERPIPIASPAEVEVIARSLPCARCGAPPIAIEHTAETVGDVRLRVAHAVCPRCGEVRRTFFRLGGSLPS